MQWNVFTTRGRITRTQYALYLLATWFASSFVRLIAMMLLQGSAMGMDLAAAFVILVAFSIAEYCLAVRRAHDMGRGSSFVLLMFIASTVAVIAFAVALIGNRPAASAFPVLGVSAVAGLWSAAMGLMLLFAGPDEDNRWGPDPRS